MKHGAIVMKPGTAVIALVVTAFAAGFLLNSIRSAYADSDSTAAEIRKQLSEIPRTDRAFRLVAKLVEPSVVHINSMRLVRSAGYGLPFDPLLRELFEDEMLERYYRRHAPRRGYVLRGLGSGVIVDAGRGIILTNYHVISGADEITVNLVDGRELPAKVIGTDPRTDIAVIRINARGLHAARMGDSDDIEVGQWVLAFGNPFGLDGTVTLGIVSAKGRRGMGITDYEDFIQTDCAINPGNSGGPLVNIHGEVVGINSAILSRSGGYQGIGFAVPVNVARIVMQQILETGRVVRGWLGITASDLSPDWIEKLGVPGKGGSYVLGVAPDGPAAKAGLRKGDIIIGIDGKPVEDTTTLYNRIALSSPGETISLQVFRAGNTRMLDVTVGELPEETR